MPRKSKTSKNDIKQNQSQKHMVNLSLILKNKRLKILLLPQ